ncbi:pancreatic lipase-related protein 3-like [Microplitis mediator]|uniref:pancreatic lipase-related protein 3-like n=1 Tax=Microplitis mediator TaxID=375433 RepID=UPI002556A0D3|nr:pancreatic lipase-related protein 3-like [Microplitis mediator]
MMHYKNIVYFLILFESFSYVFCVENYQDNIFFFLMRRSFHPNVQEVSVSKYYNTLAWSDFDPNKPTKVIIHGFKSAPWKSDFIAMKDRYLSVGDYNVFFVDWELLADRFYPTAVSNARAVGVFLARFIVLLKLEGAEDIHLIGHSLGAHVAAVAANYLYYYRVSRITGLDPAGPLFYTVGEDAALDAGDADFVDVYHTNAKIAGKFITCGHVDFYFNGGQSQPGCGNLDYACYHNRAVYYFSESIISTEGFWAHPCDLNDLRNYRSGNCSSSQPIILAGEYVDKSSTGSYSVVTNAQSPFAKGHHW